MVTPNRPTGVQTHEDVFSRDFRQWMVERLAAKGRAIPPTTEGNVQAAINWGRWVVECPTGCGDAVVCSLPTRNRVYACGTAGCLDSTWYAVRFPVGRAALEAALIKRPHHASGLAIHWNWVPGETLADVNAENTAHGVP